MKKFVLLGFCICIFSVLQAQPNPLYWVIETPEEGNELIIDQLKASGYLHTVLANTFAEYEGEDCQDTLQRIGRGYPISDWMTCTHLERLEVNVHESGIFVSFILKEYRMEFQIKNPNGWGEEAYVYFEISDNTTNEYYYLGDINGALLPVFDNEVSARRLVYQYIYGTEEVENELIYRVENLVEFIKSNR